jgi:AcrR family transcriptional regulator
MRSSIKKLKHGGPSAAPQRAAVLGRPRNPRIDADIVRAVLTVLRSAGYRAVTFENIARRAMCARTTLYRRWPSKRHLVAFAIVHELGLEPAPDSGSLRADLEAALHTLSTAFAGPLRSAIAGLVADMAHDASLARFIRDSVLAPRRNSMRAAFRRGQARGEIVEDLDIDVLLDMATAPYYFRALFGHERISAGMSPKIVDCVLRAAGIRRATAHTAHQSRRRLRARS